MSALDVFYRKICRGDNQQGAWSRLHDFRDHVADSRALASGAAAAGRNEDEVGFAFFCNRDDCLARRRTRHQGFRHKLKGLEGFDNVLQVFPKAGRFVFRLCHPYQ